MWLKKRSSIVLNPRTQRLPREHGQQSKHVEKCTTMLLHKNTNLLHSITTYQSMQNKLPAWKNTWKDWSNVYSKCLQMAVRRIKTSEKALEELEERGFKTGRLKWKAPLEYRSIKYNQSGFDVDSNTGRTNHATVNFTKIGDFQLNYHRPLPENTDIIEVILKKQKTGEWTVSIVVDYDESNPEKPDIDNIDIEDTVGIDLGITNFIHDSDGRAIKPLDEEQDRSRIEKRHQHLDCKEHGSNNWNEARQELSKAYQRLSNKRQAYREQLANEYTTKYDAVFLEDLNVASMMQQDKNSRNIASMSWYETIQCFKEFGDKNGCHVVLVPPGGTTKECVRCGTSTDKPLWVREHSCPSCGFELDRDWNSSLEAQRRGLVKLGVVESSDDRELGQELAESTLAETGIPVDDSTEASVEVTAKTVVDTRSSVLKEPALAGK